MPLSENMPSNYSTSMLIKATQTPYKLNDHLFIAAFLTCCACFGIDFPFLRLKRVDFFCFHTSHTGCSSSAHPYISSKVDTSGIRAREGMSRFVECCPPWRAHSGSHFAMFLMVLNITQFRICSGVKSSFWARLFWYRT